MFMGATGAETFKIGSPKAFVMFPIESNKKEGCIRILFRYSLFVTNEQDKELVVKDYLIFVLDISFCMKVKPVDLLLL